VAYQAAPGRLLIQVHALAYDDIDAWIADLSERPPSLLRDAPGAALIAALLAAVAAERAGFVMQWSEPAAAERLAGVAAALAAPLERLRERMWEQSGAAPPLTVLDCPALGRAGRATAAGGARLVAVSLSQPRDHVLCQILHEEMHPLTDPLVRADRSERDTRVGTPGAALHAELEAVAVAATEAFLSARAPELLTDFVRWKQRLGMA